MGIRGERRVSRVGREALVAVPAAASGPACGRRSERNELPRRAERREREDRRQETGDEKREEAGGGRGGARTRVEEDAGGSGCEQRARAEPVEEVGADERPEDERHARDRHAQADLALAAARAAQACEEQRLHLLERAYTHRPLNTEHGTLQTSEAI